MAKYLDETGLGIVWAEIKKRLDGKGSGLEYDSANTKIYLKDADGNRLGDGIDAAPFIKDGMLDDVTTVVASVESPIVYDGNGTGDNGTYVAGEKFIKFVWNADGKEKVDYLLASEIGKVYTAGDGVSLDGDVISINKVDATKTKLGTDIQIAGGPLANNVIDSVDVWPTGWTDASGNKIIPAGQSMEQILTALFLKVVNGTVAWGSASWSPSLAKPTVALSSNGPVEVGSKVKVSTLTAGAATAGTRSVTCACSQGHYLADAEGNPTGSHVSGNKTISVAASVTGTASLACTWNNVATDVTVNSTELTVVEGTNTIKASQSGQTATCEALPTTKIFAATNTKSVLADVSALFSEDKPADKPLTSENTDIINAYYPIYTNGKQGTVNAQSNETVLVADDATKLNLVADNTIFYVLFAPMIDGGTGYRLLVKSGKKITQAMALNTLNGKYEVDMKSSFVKADGTVKKLSGGVEIDYDVYEAKGSAGANALQIKID